MSKKILLLFMLMSMLGSSITANAMTTISDEDIVVIPEVSKQKEGHNSLLKGTNPRDTGRTQISSFFGIVNSYEESTSTITNDKITTTNYLIVAGIQVDSYQTSSTNTKSDKTKAIFGTADLTNPDTYSHSTHIFECKGYKTNVLNSSNT